MKPERYNGWTNYETWCVALWLDNDGYMECLRQDAETENTVEWTIDRLAEHLNDYVVEMNPLTNVCSMYSDLLNSALSEVDYYEIAANHLSAE